MVAWLRESASGMDLDYLIIPGDVVDGIGIFPGQQEELSIANIYKQYHRLAELLKEIPDHIKIVLQPGNHDAVRPAEPQPALSKVFAESFDSNVMLTANPVYLNIEGRTILTYHGRSIDDWIAGVQNKRLTYEDPVGVMKEMLERRHLAPMYGMKTALAPERKDYMVIEKRPDIFVTGHVHGADTQEHKGIRLIAASTWQDQTEYQRMHNFNPEPGVMPIVHLGTVKTILKGF
jgi:DNA polymerase II small subunit